jgi:hypothetical protein
MKRFTLAGDSRMTQRAMIACCSIRGSRVCFFQQCRAGAFQTAIRAREPRTPHAFCAQSFPQAIFDAYWRHSPASDKIGTEEDTVHSPRGAGRTNH